MAGLLSFFGRRAAPGGPQVEHPVCVVGDVHGCCELLEALLARIADELPEAQVVTVGDYVDRGPDSRGVLDVLFRRRREVLCLRGNHEDMLLRFLDDPEANGRLWLRNGGVQTLASYGVDLAGGAGTGGLAPIASDLRAAMGEVEDWLRDLPLWWRTGGIFVSHAGGDPNRPPEDQDAHDLLWGHPDFGRTARRDALWAAHGHTIVDEPYAAGGHIATDTGAFFTGQLTAALIVPGAPVRFIQT